MCLCDTEQKRGCMAKESTRYVCHLHLCFYPLQWLIETNEEAHAFAAGQLSVLKNF